MHKAKIPTKLMCHFYIFLKLICKKSKFVSKNTHIHKYTCLSISMFFLHDIFECDEQLLFGLFVIHVVHYRLYRINNIICGFKRLNVFI